MELAQEISPKRTRLALIGVVVALAAALLIPAVGRTTAAVDHDTVAPVTLTTSVTGRETYEKHLAMVRAFSRLDVEGTTSVCLPCIVRQHRPQVTGRS